MSPDQEETYSPKAVTGTGFDDLMRRVAKLPPGKPKKASRPARQYVTCHFSRAELDGKSAEASWGDSPFDVIVGTIDYAGSPKKALISFQVERPGRTKIRMLSQREVDSI